MAECPKCGVENSAESRFCQACGSALSSPESPREERKLVSVLFIDLVGFTSRSDRADPEDVRALLQDYYACAREQIEPYGGAIEKFIGDAVMAVFGAPVAHGDDAERAVRAGLRVLEAIDALNRDRPALDLAVRAAVNTGEAVVAVGPGHDPGDALATGDVVNTASRLQTNAPPGKLIVGEETYRATRHVIRYETLPVIDAKGKSDPVDAWLAVEPIAAPAERPLTRTPLVGRGRELELISSIWARATSERRPHLVTIVGPAGIGKSRLSREIAGAVEGSAGRALWGRCLPYEERAAYHAFGQVLKQVSEIYETDPVDASREKLASAVASLLPEAEASETTRFLSLLLGLGVDEPTDERHLVFFAARRFLERLADLGPILVVIEDVHWSDTSQLELLEYLAAHVRDAPIVFLALARPEFLEERLTWGAGLLSQTTIPLEPLTASESAEVVAALLAGAHAASIDRLVAVAEGNPLFIEELAASLAESGSVEELPTTVRAAIASRIDSLPAGPRTALFDASVIGKTFWRGVLGALSGAEDVDGSLEALEARDLIRRRPSSAVEGDVEFSFKHMTIREVAYATIPRATRRERHEAVARFFEASIGGREELAWILAHHWREAGEPARAIDYLLQAAQRARQGLATDETYELYTLALELAPDDVTATRVRLLRALALTELEDFERADTELSELEPLLEGRDLLEALLAHARAATWTEKTDAALALAERADALARSSGETDLVGPAIARLAVAHGMRGGKGDIDRALELGDRAMEAWVPGTRTLDLAEHHHMHADVHYWTGRFERAAELSRAARELSADPHSAEALLRGGGLEALALSGLGRYEEAIAAFDAVIAKAHELGRTVGVLLNYSTAAFRDVFDLPEARARSEEALSQAVAWSGFSMPSMNSRTDLVATALLEGDIGGAQAAWPAIWDDAFSTQGWTRWLIAGRLAAAKAEISWHAETPEAAAQWAQRSLDLATPVHRLKYEALSRIVLGRALLAMKRTEDGLEQLRLGVACAARLGSPPLRWGALAALGAALYATGDDDVAGSAYAEAAAIIHEVAEDLAPERAARYLAASPVVEVLSLATRSPT